MSNSAPTLRVAPSAEYVRSQLAARLSPTVLLSDADRRTLASASVAITAGFRRGDYLFSDVSGTNIARHYDSGTGVLTLTGVDTLVRYEQVLASVRYVSRDNDMDDDCFDTAREISWSVSDGTDPSEPQRTRVAIRLHA
jgi:hypothetical protein